MSRLWRRIALVVALFLIVAGTLLYVRLRPQAMIGAGYVAHQVCSCVFVAERSYESCLPDMPSSMDRVRSEIIDEENRHGVRAWVTGLADRTALVTPGLGCALQ